MSFINKTRTPNINRGVELVLRRRTPKKKTFSFCFDKVVSFLNREITIYFNFSLNIGKPK
jgi:hypothetical protein